MISTRTFTLYSGVQKLRQICIFFLNERVETPWEFQTGLLYHQYEVRFTLFCELKLLVQMNEFDLSLKFLLHK